MFVVNHSQKNAETTNDCFLFSSQTTRLAFTISAVKKFAVYYIKNVVILILGDPQIVQILEKTELYYLKYCTNRVRRFWPIFWSKI